jgi:hypothetical protein
MNLVLRQVGRSSGDVTLLERSGVDCAGFRRGTNRLRRKSIMVTRKNDGLDGRLIAAGRW